MVVIVGAGIVGAATAYYLSASSGAGTTPITILDAAGPAAGSSGKAGAFLTNRPPAFRRGIGKNDNDKVSDKRRALFEKSFELHQQLAKDLELDSFCPIQNYQTVETKELDFDEDTDEIRMDGTYSSDDERIPGRRQQSNLNKLADNGRGTPLPGDAALVDPAELISSMMYKILSKKGSLFRKASISGLTLDPSGSCVTGIQIEGDLQETIPVEEDEPVVIALGPWTSRIEDWLGIPMPIEGVLSTSMIYEEGILDSDIGTAFFFDDDSNGCHLEVFGRRDKSLYVSGCGESQVISTRRLRSKERPSPTQPCDPDLARAAAARTSLQNAGYNRGHASTNGPDQHPDATQACIRPMSPDGIPVVGKLLDNVYVATGGGPWGITWGPLMGQSLASLINDDDDTPIRLGPLSPRRFNTLVYKTLLKSRSSEDDNENY
jgi:glycine/D-amino acid oxidase-like deaminating enzyme